MSDIKLDTSTDDLFIDDGGDLVLTAGQEAIEQHLMQRLRTFFGEWFLDQREGIPYFQHVFVKQFNPTVIDSIFKSLILKTPGIEELLFFDLDLTPETRELRLDFRARTIEGEINFSEVIP